MAHQQSSAAPIGGGNPWSNYFGPASHEIQTNAYDKYAYETYDLPEAYKGKNLFLRDTIDGFIMDDNEWYTRVCLPYAQTDQIHLRWNEWHFNQTLAGRVPHEGISRLITSSKRAFKDHTVRRGLAFILEHGFMNTAEGREQYRRNLIGIKQCVQETNNHDVISSLIGARNYDREWERKHGLYNRPLKQIMRREVNEWAIVQKDIPGLEILHEEYKKKLSRYGVTPNIWIFPPKMSIYAAMVPPSEDSKLRDLGESTAASFKQGPSSLGSFRGIPVFETRMFDVYENELPIDLLRRNQQIGEYYVMSDPHKYNDKYKGEEVSGLLKLAGSNARKVALQAVAAARKKRVATNVTLKAAIAVEAAADPTDKTAAAAKVSAALDEVRAAHDDAEEKTATYEELDQAGYLVKQRKRNNPSHRDIIIYNEELDNWHRIEFREAVAKAVNKALVAGGRNLMTLGDLFRDGDHLQDASHGSLSVLPSFIVDRDQATEASPHRIETVSGASTKTSFARKDGYVGVYQSAIRSDGSIGKATSGDTQALFSSDFTTQAEWKATHVNNVLQELEEGVPSKTLIQHCEDIIKEAEAPPAPHTGIRRSIASRQDYSSKRRRGGGDVVDSILFEDNYHHSKVPAVDQYSDEYNYAKNVLKHYNRLIGTKKKRTKTEFDHETGILGTRLSTDYLELALAGGYRLPFDVLLLRPWMEYEMSSAILMRGGHETGATFVGHSDFILGDDVISKLHYGNFTFYSKALVTNPKNVILARNIFCQGYVRGNGCRFFEHQAGTSEMKGYAPDTGDHEADLISVIIPYGSGKELPNPLNIMGFHEYDYTKAKSNRPHEADYYGATRVTELFQLETYHRDMDSAAADIFLADERTQNTICYRGHQFSYDVNRKCHAAVSINTGHWGPNVYPGCGRVRAGEMKYLEKCDYKRAHAQ
jgi:hypothetical protein